MAKASKGLDERHCRTWDDLRAQIQGVQATLRDSGEVLWFRGCREANHSLLPSLMRDTTKGKNIGILVSCWYLEENGRGMAPLRSILYRLMSGSERSGGGSRSMGMIEGPLKSNFQSW
jgi:hypothetical protein